MTRRWCPQHNPVGVEKNYILDHTRALFRGESARADAQLVDDFASVMQGRAIYLKSVVADASDFALMKALTDDMEEHAKIQAAAAAASPASTSSSSSAASSSSSTSSSSSSTDEKADKDEPSTPPPPGMISWSKHYKYEQPDFPSFRKIVDFLSVYFDIEVLASRLNYYPDSSSWKPFHKDSHAYGANGAFLMCVCVGARVCSVCVRACARACVRFYVCVCDCAFACLCVSGSF
jgi:hypothetical protein